MDEEEVFAINKYQAKYLQKTAIDDDVILIGRIELATLYQNIGFSRLFKILGKYNYSNIDTAEIIDKYRSLSGFIIGNSSSVDDWIIQCNRLLGFIIREIQKHKEKDHVLIKTTKDDCVKWVYDGMFISDYFLDNEDKVITISRNIKVVILPRSKVKKRKIECGLIKFIRMNKGFRSNPYISVDRMVDWFLNLSEQDLTEIERYKVVTKMQDLLESEEIVKEFQV